MLNWSLKVILTASNSDFVPAALVVASLNMLVQILLDACFGHKNNMKIRGDRGE